jgi:hypothetical protein
MFKIERNVFEKPTNFVGKEGAFKIDVFEKDEELASSELAWVSLRFSLFGCVLCYEWLQLLYGVDLQQL